MKQLKTLHKEITLMEVTHITEYISCTKLLTKPQVVYGTSDLVSSFQITTPLCYTITKVYATYSYSCTMKIMTPHKKVNPLTYTQCTLFIPLHG